MKYLAMFVLGLGIAATSGSASAQSTIETTPGGKVIIHNQAPKPIATATVHHGKHKTHVTVKTKHKRVRHKVTTQTVIK